MRKITLFFLCLFLWIQLPEKTHAADKIPILIYHSIDEFTGHGVRDLFVSPENFEKQMIYLRDHGFTLLTFEQWGDRNNVKKPVFITIDDGYKNNLNVLKIFQKLKSDTFTPRATIFAISDYIGWPDRLSNTDLKKMSDTGMFSIQSHTATHPDLRKIDDYKHELKDSKDKIQSITGKAVIALSYPYGYHNDKVIEETKKYYKFAVATDPKYYLEKGTKNEDYLLPRIYIKYDYTMNEFAKIVEGQAKVIVNFREPETIYYD
ncbi:polysaccharide deacetylase [Bacillus sp. AFS001701]|uniref:polysaccharide deacetylase family protein n=1 Tax=Bacillaceae TaxID=186817 RepID=UPI000BF734B1|nr:polysaccharide deacetylase family protein [Bacillus sp. AFS001701]PET66878.1 polysaccharide deacetylase [Bacillus sp. AFS001701]